MIPLSTIQNLAKKLQTTELNVRREYLQHLFLSYFYQRKEAEDILFKGGTALRLAFASPRFSEDLDFSARFHTCRQLENIISDSLQKIQREGIVSQIVESKITSGGYLADIMFYLGSDRISLLLQISLRQPKTIGEVVTIAGDFIPPYPIILLNQKHLIDEKIQALLTRSKPRDFYDLYFLIRSNLLNREQKKLLAKIKNKLDSTPINFSRELKQFLPQTHWPVIKNFKTNLGREIDKFSL